MTNFFTKRIFYALAIASIIGIGFVKISYASTLLYDTGTLANGNPAVYVGTYKQFSTTSSIQISRFDLKLSNDYTATGTITANLGWSDTATSPGSTSTVIHWLATTTINSTSIAPFSVSWASMPWIAFDFSTNYDIEPNKFIIVKIKNDNGTNLTYNNDISGAAIPYRCIGSDYTCNQSSTLALRLYGTNPNVNGISMVNPTQSSTVQDFYNWEVGITGVSATTSYQVRVMYWADNDSSTVYYDSLTNSNLGLGSVTVLISKSVPLITSSFMQTSTKVWHARPILDNGISYLYGSEISFTVQAPFGTPSQPDWTASSVVAYVSSTLGGPELACTGQLMDTYAGLPWLASSSLDYGICQIKRAVVGTVSFFFVPNDGTIEYAKSTVKSFQGVAPFNFTIGAIEMFQAELQTNSDNKPTDSLTFNITPQNSGQLTFTLLSDTMMEDALGDAFVTWWNNIILMLAIVFFAYGIYKLSF